MTKKADKKEHKKRRNVVNMEELTQYAVNGLKQVEYWSKGNTGDYSENPDMLPFKRPKASSHTPSVKMKYYRRIATHIKKSLFDSGRKSEENKIALTTYHKYLTKIRRELRKAGYRHPNLSNALLELSKEYPSYKSRLNRIDNADAVTVGYERRQVIDELTSMNKVDADMLSEKLEPIPFNHPLVDLLVKSKVQRRRRNNEINENLAARKSNVIQLRYADIERTIQNAFTSNNFYELAIGVALATGRRAIEVCYQGEFKESATYALEFSGQAKKGAGVDTKPYKIPTLLPASEIVEAVKKLRSTEVYNKLVTDFSQLDIADRNEKINKRIARMLNYNIKKLLDPNTKRADSERQFKDTRLIAVRVAIDKIKNASAKHRKLDDDAFIKGYIGHDGFSEVMHYRNVHIDYDAPATTTEPKSQSKTKSVGDVDISDLEAIDSLINDTGDKPVYKLHEKVKALATRTGFSLNQSAIYKGRKLNGVLEKAGGSLPVVKRYLAFDFVNYAIDQYNQKISN